MQDNKKDVKKNKTGVSKKKTESKAANMNEKRKNVTAKKKEEKVASENVVDNKKDTTAETNKKNKKKAINDARRKLNYEKTTDGEEISKLIKIILIVTAVMVVFYGITVVVTKKASEVSQEQNSEKTEIQYDNIVIGSMLKIDGSFYVLIEDEDDQRLSEYETLKQTIAANPDAPTIYIAHLSDGFNSKYLGEESNYSSDMTKFKVTGTTLVKIDNHKITETYDSYDKINKKMNELE